MMKIINYISAIRRLKESEKTVYMMGGEDECPTQLLAQRDMIKLEKEYYKDECFSYVYILCFIAVCVMMAISYNMLRGITQ